MKTSRWHIAWMLAVLTVTLLALTACTLDYYEDEADDPAAYYDDDYYYESESNVVFDEFEELQFWGQWFELSPYGTVWRPTVVLGWRPYENGHWAWGGHDWIWVSYEPFGWATFHYGFWVYDMVWGWVWIPDYEWSAARVEWVVYDDFIAWAPLPPGGYRIGEPWIATEIDYWHVVPARHFTKNNVGSYHKRYKQNYRIKNRSTVRYKPPMVTNVEVHTATTIRPIVYNLDEQTRRGERSVKRIRLPDSETKRISRFKERVEMKIKATDAPPKPPADRSYQDDRIVPKRERGKKEDTRKPETRKEKPKKENPKKKYEKKPTKPVKQEPNKPQQKKPTKTETKPVKKKKKG